MTHLDVYKTWRQVFKAEPMRQAKAEAALAPCQNATQATHTWFWCGGLY